MFGAFLLGRQFLTISCKDGRRDNSLRVTCCSTAHKSSTQSETWWKKDQFQICSTRPGDPDNKLPAECNLKPREF